MQCSMLVGAYRAVQPHSYLLISQMLYRDISRALDLLYMATQR